MFLLRIVAAKNSRKCSLALSPAAAMIAGTGNVPGADGQERGGCQLLLMRGLWQRVQCESGIAKSFRLSVMSVSASVRHTAAMIMSGTEKPFPLLVQAWLQMPASFGLPS